MSSGKRSPCRRPYRVEIIREPRRAFLYRSSVEAAANINKHSVHTIDTQIIIEYSYFICTINLFHYNSLTKHPTKSLNGTLILLIILYICLLPIYNEHAVLVVVQFTHTWIYFNYNVWQLYIYEVKLLNYTVRH